MTDKCVYVCWNPDMPEYKESIQADNHEKAAWKFFWIEIKNIGEEYSYDFDIYVKIDKKYARKKLFTVHAKAELNVDLKLKENITISDLTPWCFLYRKPCFEKTCNNDPNIKNKKLCVHKVFNCYLLKRRKK